LNDYQLTKKQPLQLKQRLFKGGGNQRGPMINIIVDVFLNYIHIKEKYFDL